MVATLAGDGSIHLSFALQIGGENTSITISKAVGGVPGIEGSGCASFMPPVLRMERDIRDPARAEGDRCWILAFSQTEPRRREISWHTVAD
jgi:hypothetical protein